MTQWVARCFAPPSCVTVNGCPAMLIVAVRTAAFGFAATLYDTLPLPVPAPAVTVSHESLLVAVQAQPGSAKSWNRPVDAAMGGRVLVVENV